uniref:Apt1 n=1 Tax=Arundo donax TaxID=35708 RepID=A0A0A9E1P4_ARUDO
MKGIHKEPYITNSKWQSFICEKQFNLADLYIVEVDQFLRSSLFHFIRLCNFLLLTSRANRTC